ncbi:MAG TPA: hypothetical protein VGH30_01520 [Jatrophihabitantaceae bacterium]|jgi:hypothetical protein
MTETKHVNQRIARRAPDVYDYVVNPENIPAWAPGLGSAVEQIDGRWFVTTGMGLVELTFAPANHFGVLDHDVTLPSGEVVYNPMRVIANGDVSDIVFTLRRRSDVSEQDFEADAAAVAADLARLKDILESVR